MMREPRVALQPEEQQLATGAALAVAREPCDAICCEGEYLLCGSVSVIIVFSFNTSHRMKMYST